ncbi:MAG: hypothetical protein K6G55_05270 [Selenomonadaceae bacterium]|nr:hypothetical protein [Selenomonadaceae bacterium]
MQCRRCGKELTGSMRCNFCGYENTEGNVREMTPTEKTFFNGVTIDAGSDNSRSSYDNSRDQKRTYRANGFSINFGGSNFLTRAITSFVRAVIGGNRIAQAAAALIFVAFAALTFFIALPILFFILAVGLAVLAFAKIMG